MKVRNLLKALCWVPIIGVPTEIYYSVTYENYLSSKAYPLRRFVSAAYHGISLGVATAYVLVSIGGIKV